LPQVCHDGPAFALARSMAADARSPASPRRRDAAAPGRTEDKAMTNAEKRLLLTLASWVARLEEGLEAKVGTRSTTAADIRRLLAEIAPEESQESRRG
jgi:hypothetical protein